MKLILSTFYENLGSWIASIPPCRWGHQPIADSASHATT